MVRGMLGTCYEERGGLRRKQGGGSRRVTAVASWMSLPEPSSEYCRPPESDR